MGIYAIKLPDVGEGVAEAEVVEWHVKVGDAVREDDVLAAVMTDKANIEIPSSVSGTVTWLAGDIGETVAVGADLIRLEVAGEGNVTEADLAEATIEVAPPPPAPAPKLTEPAKPKPSPEVSPARPAGRSPAPTAAPQSRGSANGRPLAAPSVRKRARDAGIDLRHVAGTGPAGRIGHHDLDAFIAGETGSERTNGGGRTKNTSVEEIKVVGLRRRIAERMALANAKIPHITIVEEVDVTNLEDLRAELNATHGDTRTKLTLLPFVMKAIVTAVAEQPEMNAHFHDDAGIITQFGGVHIGVATQTSNGLIVPVVRHAEANSLWDNAGEVQRLAEAAREGAAERDELSGSTLTITSLGPLGAIATTPIINHPEVAIVGINKMTVRPWWDGQQFVPRTMMNLSCSFDHRVIDGWNAAVFVQKLKTLLEKPAMLFVES